MKIFKLISLICAMAYLTAGQEKQEPDTLIAHGGGKSITWYQWIGPTPCIRAEVLLTTTGGQDPMVALQNLSVEQLHGRYRGNKKTIDDAWAESRRTKTSIDENKMRKQKRQLASPYVRGSQ